MCRGGGKLERAGVGRTSHSFSPNLSPRLKDSVGERAGQALCENGGGRRLCGLGTGRAFSEPHLYQHAWAVRDPRGGHGGGAASMGWQGSLAGTGLTGLCLPLQGQIQPELPVPRYSSWAGAVCVGPGCESRSGELTVGLPPFNHLGIKWRYECSGRFTIRHICSTSGIFVATVDFLLLFLPQKYAPLRTIVVHPTSLYLKAQCPEQITHLSTCLSPGHPPLLDTCLILFFGPLTSSPLPYHLLPTQQQQIVIFLKCKFQHLIF